ncbi:MAG: hypothetical protein HLUCCA12_12215 [Rhodobacteraceae bacterium HLUCCA12]|nr:MAG: hypothetical protein HLUCCA12_12215 [Rhodobacteraceae bacterium HLUCCA12]
MRLLSLLLLAAVLVVCLGTPAQADPLSALFLSLKAFAGTTIGGLIFKVAAAFVPTMLGRLLAQKPKQPGVRIDGMTGGEEIPQSFPIGRRSVPGHLRYHNSHGGGDTPNEFYQMVISVSDLPGVALRRLRVGDKYTDLGETLHPKYGAPMLRFRRQGQDNGWIRFYDGTQTEADPDLVNAYENDPDEPWTDNHIGYGIAYAIITLRLNREVWQGLPEFRFVLDGIPLYDPRKDTSVGGDGSHRWDDPSTWESSENLAVMVYNILRGIPLPDGNIYGGRIPAEDLPLSNAIAGMNVCDVDLGNRLQFTGGLELRVDREPAEVIEELLKAGLGHISETGGVFRTRWGAPDLPVYSFTDDDIVITAPRQYDPFPGLQDTHNAIRVSHPSTSNLWEPVQTPIITNADWEEADGGRRLITQLSVPACFNHGQAQHLARAYIEDARRFRTHTIVLPPDAQVLEALDATEWSSDKEGYADKIFEVTEVEYLPFSLLVGVTLRERDPADFVPHPEEELPPPPELDPTPVDARTTPDTSWSLTPSSIRDAADEPRRPAFDIGVVPEAFRDARAIRYRAKVAATGEVITSGRFSPEDGSARVSDGVVAGESYEVEIRPIMDRETAWSDPKAVTVPDVRLRAGDLDDNILPDLFEEAGVSPIRIVDTLPASGEENELVWLRPESKLYRWDGSEWVTAAPQEFDWDDFPEDARPLRMVDTLPTNGEMDELVWLRPEKRIYRWDGSDWVPNVSEVDVDSFPPELRPIEVVTALPTSGNFEGRLVLFEGDIYRFHDGDWTRNVPAEAIDGELLEEQIGDGAINTAKFAAGLRPIEIVSTLPGTPHVQGRTVLLTTDNKLYRNTGSGWTAAVPADDIAGQIAAAQIAALEASKITGQLSNDQIAALAAAKLTGQIAETQISDSAISTPKLASGAITTAKLAADAVTADKVAANAITAAAISTGSVTTAKLAAGAVEADKIAASAVTADKVAANAITAAKLAANAVTAGKIAAGAVTADEIAAGAIVASKLAIGDFSNLNPDPTYSDPEAWSGDFTIKTTGNPTDWGTPRIAEIEGEGSEFIHVHGPAFKVQPGDELLVSVKGSNVTDAGTGTVHLVVYDDDTLTGATSIWGSPSTINFDTAGIEEKSATYTIPSGKNYARTRFYKSSNGATLVRFGAIHVRRKATGELIVDGAIQTHHMEAGSINADRLAANSISATQIAADAITATQIASGTITATQIATRTITANRIATGAITATEIASRTITADRIVSGTLTANEIASRSITASRIVAGTLTANEIATGSITADRLNVGTVRAALVGAHAIQAENIAAGAITASKLTITSFANLIANPDFELGGTDWVLGGDTTTTATSPQRGSTCLRADRSTTANYIVARSNTISCDPGDTFLLRGWGRSLSGLTGDFWLQARFLDDSGSVVNTQNLVWDDTNGNWQERSGIVTAPSGAARLQIYPYSVASGTMFWDNLSLTRAANGELIVDGAIAARHIDVEDLVADTAFIENLTVVNANIEGNIESDNYAESGGTPTDGFQLDRDNGKIKGVEFTDRLGIVRGAITSTFFIQEAVSFNGKKAFDTWHTIGTLEFFLPGNDDGLPDTVIIRPEVGGKQPNYDPEFPGSTGIYYEFRLRFYRSGNLLSNSDWALAPFWQFASYGNQNDTYIVATSYGCTPSTVTFYVDTADANLETWDRIDIQFRYRRDKLDGTSGNDSWVNSDTLEARVEYYYR